MNTSELLLIAGIGLVAYLVINKASPVVQPYQTAPTPVPSVSPYWGYPSNIMNPSASANNGSGWTSENTSALIGALGGLGSQAIKSFS